MSRSRSRSPSRTAFRSPVKRGASADEEANTCPFLIRVFVTKGSHAPMVDFDEGNFPIRDEFQVYGWKTSTPTSLITLLYPSFPPPYRSPLARYSFRHIYVDASQRGLYRSTDLVSFTGRDLMTTLDSEKSTAVVGMDMELDDSADMPRKGKKVEEKSLDEYGFITGDLLSVSLYVPEPRLHAGPNRPPPSGMSGANTSGWGDRRASGALGGGREELHPADQAGTWSRGEALPPRGGLSIRGSRNGPNRDSRDAARASGMGIRGAGRRSPSVTRNGYRDGDRPRRDSRSPAARDRRESWSRR